MNATATDRLAFFADCDGLDRLVLRPLSHIRMNWETTWDQEAQCYAAEDDSFAAHLNELIADIARASPPARYHDHEDRLAENVVANLKWPIVKKGGRWVGADYDSILQNGAPADLDQNDLILAASGRVTAALARGQIHFDGMEKSHRHMLAAVMSIIIYWRSDWPAGSR